MNQIQIMLVPATAAMPSKNLNCIHDRRIYSIQYIHIHMHMNIHTLCTYIHIFYIDIHILCTYIHIFT